MKSNKSKEKIIYNYDFLNNKINEYLEYYDIELNDFAISIGMSEKTLKRTLNNDRYFYVNEVYRIADLLAFKGEDVQKAFFTIEEV